MKVAHRVLEQARIPEVHEEPPPLDLSQVMKNASRQLAFLTNEHSGFFEKGLVA